MTTPTRSPGGGTGVGLGWDATGFAAGFLETFRFGTGFAASRFPTTFRAGFLRGAGLAAFSFFFSFDAAFFPFFVLAM